MPNKLYNPTQIPGLNTAGSSLENVAGEDITIITGDGYTGEDSSQAGTNAGDIVMTAGNGGDGGAGLPTDSGSGGDIILNPGEAGDPGYDSYPTPCGYGSTTMYGVAGDDGKVIINSTGADPLLKVFGDVEANNVSNFTASHKFPTADTGMTIGDSVYADSDGWLYKTNQTNQKNCIGIVSNIREIREDDTLSLTDDISPYLTIITSGITTGITWSGETSGITSGITYDIIPRFLVNVAAVGDARILGQLEGFKICNENGGVSGGTLLVTSSKPGFLMAQSDDILKAHTVGKTLFDVEFDEDGESIGNYGFLYSG